ncbi:T9SS type A sorting domain-containing protein [Flavobacterium wongokense]|uniref:T9SS type A sorting domain-containing protein n=1 Tax=Flavobacterium wongokense TaxID=2910674 RepID=UPI001F16820D|nr:T9SS type A sorting domain-containing protein [Flavobacterium sp. WG47]MCF6133084.1 T9SS type A sorting domain-containing protein [Flavobacterium sp. WG47]
MRKIYFLLFLFIINKAMPQAGELDPNFGVAGFFISDDEELDTGDGMAILPDNSIIMIGGHDHFSCIKLSPNGVLDTSFDTDGKAYVTFEGLNAGAYDIAIQPDGKIILAGCTYLVGGEYHTTIARLNADGSLDTTFNGTGSLTFDYNAQEKNYCYSVALQTDGKIVVAGHTGSSGATDFAMARINPDGTFDNNFGNNGKLTLNILGSDYAKSVLIQPDGKILVCGYSYPGPVCSFAVVRLTSTGDLDNTFNGDGIMTTKVASSYGNDTVQDMALQADGKIVVLSDCYIGSHQIIGAIRLTTAGELDTTFSGDGKFSTTMNNTSDFPKGVAIQPDGKIILAGSYYNGNGSGTSIFAIRLTTGGDLDTSFSGDGKANFLPPNGNGPVVYDTKLQSTGQILISGYSGGNNFMIARIFTGNELGLTELESNTVGFYPNPVAQTINFTEDIAEASIFSLDGKLVAKQKNTFGQMDVSNLQEGIYIIETKTTEDKINQQQLVIKR